MANLDHGDGALGDVQQANQVFRLGFRVKGSKGVKGWLCVEAEKLCALKFTKAARTESSINLKKEYRVEMSGASPSFDPDEISIPLGREEQEEQGCWLTALVAGQG